MEMRMQLRSFSSVLPFLIKILYWDMRNCAFIQNLLSFVSTKTVENLVKSGPGTRRELKRGDISLVMDSLGIQQCFDDNIVGIDDDEEEEEVISSLFDGGDVSLDEVKEAFDVFDENRDGFIDGMELQRVFRRLGQHGKTELEECNKMIGHFDENGDGFIDFSEFIRLMEKCSF